MNTLTTRFSGDARAEKQSARSVRLLAVGAALVLAGWLQVHLGLRPLRTLQRSVEEVARGRLRQLEGDYPSELQPLVQKVKGRGIFRALFYIPTLTSAAVTAQVAFAFISPYDGVLNEILKLFGQPIVVWTINASWMRAFIIVYSIWRGVGGPVVLFLAALQGIHREVYEAAMVDGANGAQMLLYITLPLLRPMIIFVLVTGMIGSFQIFEAVLLMSKGGPANKTNVMLLQIYNDAFVNTNMGLASAGSVIMAILLLGFSITNMRIMSRGQVAKN